MRILHCFVWAVAPTAHVGEMEAGDGKDDMREAVRIEDTALLCVGRVRWCYCCHAHVGDWASGDDKDNMREAVRSWRPTSLDPWQQTHCLLLCCPIPSRFTHHLLPHACMLAFLQGLPALLVSLFSVYTANVGAVPELRPVAAQVLRCLQLMAAGDEAMQVGLFLGGVLFCRPGGEGRGGQ